MVGPPDSSANLIDCNKVYSKQAYASFIAKNTLGTCHWPGQACRYSKKAYATIRRKVQPAYQSRSFAVQFYHMVQPWHPQSTLTHEAGLAVAREAGPAAFWDFSDAMFDQQEAFFDRMVYDKTRPQVAADLAKLAHDSTGVPAQVIERQLALTPGNDPHPGSNINGDLKLYVKWGRQQGVHVTPTCTVNGIITDTSSSWTEDQWRELLDPLFGRSNVEGWTTLLNINF